MLRTSTPSRATRATAPARRCYRFVVAAAALLVVGIALAGRGARAVCDLEVYEPLLRSSVQQTTKSFTAHDCSFQDNCVNGEGERKLLGFSVGVGNNGPDDLVIGEPSNATNAHYDACLGNYLRSGFFAYKLLDKDSGDVVAPGKKQAWCTEDSKPFPKANTSDAQVRNSPRYTCSYQGISVGWMDIYSRTFHCQWIDVTDVTPGKYTLQVIVNEDRSIEETNYDNNKLEINVTVN